MKKVNLLPLALFAMLSCVACQQEPLIEDASFDDSPITTIDASVETVEDPEAPETKSTLDYSGLFTWESDDVISFWPSSGDVLPGDTPTCVKFKVAQGGSSTATFVGSGWALKRSSTYYASMPFNSSDKYNKVSLDYSGQSQAANDDDSHLGAYDYLHAYFTTPATGNSSITFERIGTIAKFVLTIPDGLAAKSFTSLTLSCDDAVFPANVYYDPSKSAVTLSKASMSKKFIISLNGNEGVKAMDGILTVYAMMPQIAWSGKTITATLEDTFLLEYSGTFTPKSNQAANKKLKYSTTVIDPDIHPDNEIMTFEDSNVKAVCVSNWDTDGDGELSYGEARAVTELPYDVFSGNCSIISFNEFKYFTGLTTTGYDRYTDEGDWEYDGAFSDCVNLTSIVLPSSLTSIGIAAFKGCRSLQEIIIPSSVQYIGGVAFLGADNLCVYMESETPPTLTKPSGSWDYGDEPYSFGYINGKIKAIYVPSEAARETYRAATYWKTYSSIIRYGLPLNIHVPEIVDLGLPSGLKWASFNLGASKPEEYGGYFQWAGLDDVTDTSINLNWDNCPYHTGSGGSTGWTKYVHSDKSSCWSGPGSPDNKTVLDPEDDVAHIKLGDKWRMPTKAEFQELKNNCTSENTTLNGVNGMKFISKKNGNSIFLPVAGNRHGVGLYSVGSSGYYWSSSLGTSSPVPAFYFAFALGCDSRELNRDYGLSVRPVYDVIIKATGITLDKTSLSLYTGGVAQLAATLTPSNCFEQGLVWSSGTPSVATVSTNGHVVALSEGTAVITVSWAGDSSIKASCTVSVTDSCPIPEMVDLGLPSGLKWASFNLGASKPEGFGAYFQWAGLDHVSDPSMRLDLDNCPYHTGSDRLTGWTKYIPSDKSSYWLSPGSPDNKIVLDSEDDVAHVKLGGKWRMPTKAEFGELYQNCSSEWTTLNGVNGKKFTSKKNGNSIFLPAAGYRFGVGLGSVGSYGRYWSSSLDTGNPDFAFSQNFNSDGLPSRNFDRSHGQSVRPVSE